MCNPAAAIALTALAGGVGAAGQIRQGEAAARRGNFAAAVARNNAAIAEQRADDARARGAAKETELSLRAARLRAIQRATFAANGVLVDQDSPLLLLLDTAEQGALETARARSDSAREAHGFRVQASNFRNQGVLARARGRAARRSGYISAFATILGTAGSITNDFQSNRGSRGDENNALDV